MLGFGEERIDSSVAAILIATAPLIVAVLALRFEPSERVRPAAGWSASWSASPASRRWSASTSAAAASELLGIGAVFVAACGYAIGPLILRRHFADLDPIASMAAAMAIAALALTPFAAARPPASPRRAAARSPPSSSSASSARRWRWSLMAILVREAGAGRALLVTYVNPVIAVALGVDLPQRGTGRRRRSSASPRSSSAPGSPAAASRRPRSSRTPLAIRAPGREAA